MHLGTFIATLLTENIHVWLECTKMLSPEIGTVLHWRPTDVHIFDTDPSIHGNISNMSIYPSPSNIS